jgi:hypothetical protein
MEDEGPALSADSRGIPLRTTAALHYCMQLPARPPTRQVVEIANALANLPPPKDRERILAETRAAGTQTPQRLKIRRPDTLLHEPATHADAHLANTQPTTCVLTIVLRPVTPFTDRATAAPHTGRSNQ